ncbi:hypothetical protein MMC28_001981 [Mycoblastus sanguinarius]|nr:hypothetical protein [Mycoblastus sanguinarius]
MYMQGLALLAFVASSLAAPGIPEYIEERHVVQIEKRQADVSQLLQLASLAGITALPTEPAVLLELGPLANSLASELPTSSVLAVLITAAPTGFVSSIVNDPSYASSFESAFSAGNSPAWFTSLPTSIQSYLHTYSGGAGFAGLAGAGAAVQAATSDAGGSDGNSTSSASGASGMSSMSMTTTGSSAASVASASSASAMGATSEATTEANTATTTSATAGTASSASSKAGAPHATGAIAAGVVGMLGMAAAL